MERPDPARIGLISRLARLRLRARLVLWVEAFCRAALAPCGVVLAYLLLVLLGLGGVTTEAVALAALALALGVSVRRFRRPTRRDADQRIEQATGLSHRPIAALADRPVAGGQALWRAHQARAAAEIAAARTGPPHLRLAEQDPLALRIMLLLGLFVAAIIAGPALPNRLAGFVTMPHWSMAPGETVAAWLTPPAWSGEPPRLVGEDHRITALPGSRFALIVTGGSAAAPASSFAGKPLRFTTLGKGSFRANFVLDRSGRITAGRFWNPIARYDVTIIPLVPPKIVFAAPPATDRDARRTDIAYRASDRFGLRRIGLRIAPAVAGAKSPATLEAIVIAADLARVRNVTATARLDLLSSPYAGLPVKAWLMARNTAGKDAESAVVLFTLPAPRLANASARAIEALRQQLALDPAVRAQAAAALGALAAAPPGPLTAETDLGLAAFADALGGGRPLASRPIDQLWDFVQQAEQGHAYETAKALARARAALSQGLSSMLANHRIDQRKLDRLLNDLNKALAAHMAALSAQNPNANRNASSTPQKNSRMLDPKEIDRLAQRIAREERQGDQAGARRDMQRLQNLLQQLQSAQPMSAADQARAQAAAQAKAAAGSSLSKLLQGEARLLDKTAASANAQANAQVNNPGGAMQPQGQSGLGQTQQQLRQALQQLQQSLAAAHLPLLPGLNASGKAMEQAGAHLRQGDGQGAMPGEQAAIAALQQAAGALAKLGSGGQSGGQGGGQEGLSGLGRNGRGGMGQSGIDEQGRIDLKPGQASPAQKIEQDIIRRDANPALPAPAHDYYHRLLDHPY